MRFLPVSLLLLALFAGCQILPEPTLDQTASYILTGPDLPSATTLTPSGTLQIGLRPVEIPDFLRRSRGIVVREGLNQIRSQDLARWAEPLESGVNRVLREHLLATSEIASVYVHPFPTTSKRDFDVSIRILRCEGAIKDDGTYVAKFAAAYEIIRTDGSNQVVARRVFAAPDAAWDGKDFGILVRLLSSGANALCVEIAKDLGK